MLSLPFIHPCGPVLGPSVDHDVRRCQLLQYCLCHCITICAHAVPRVHLQVSSALLVLTGTFHIFPNCPFAKMREEA